jgi:ribosome-interacting GTPase 1
LLGLLRVYLRHAGEIDDEPLALAPGATVEDVADAIHHELAASFRAGRIWGPSARFDGQRVGRGHVVADLDVVEILH